jgi:hypothetical protein
MVMLDLNYRLKQEALVERVAEALARDNGRDDDLKRTDPKAWAGYMKLARQFVVVLTACDLL